MEERCACRGSYFDKLVQPAILVVLSKGSSYGFEILNKLGESKMIAGGPPDAAGVYRMLKKMEESGVLAANWELSADGGKPRKMLTLTDEGKRCLENWKNSLTEYKESIECIIKEIEKTAE